MTDDLLASRYQLIRVLGQGAMGVVWLAQDTVLDRSIAIKELRPPPGVDASEAMDRFLVEARAAARLSHPNIVGVHDVFIDGERVLIAMELVEGPTLEEVLRTSGPQPPDVVRAIMAQVAQALAVAHTAGVIHRDLKPDNIFWTPDGRAVVTDFGLARIGAGRGTVEGTVMGTPGYMAPEQVRGTPTGPASDVFAWGAVSYTLATGQGPFGEPSVTDPTALAYRIVHEDAPPLVIPEDPALASLIATTLSKEVSRRPADGKDLVAALTGGVIHPGLAPQAAVTPVPSRVPALVMSVATGVAVVAVSLAVGRASSGSNSNGEVRQPATTTVGTMTTTVVTLPPPTIPPTDLPGGTEVIEAGTYRASVFHPTVILTFDAGWHSLIEPTPDYLEFAHSDYSEASLVSLVRVERVFDRERLTVDAEGVRVSQPRPSDLEEWIRSHPAFRAEAPADVTQPGASGVRFDVDLNDSYPYEDCTSEDERVGCVFLFDAESVDYLALTGSRYRFYVLAIGTDMVVLTIEAPVNQFDRFAAIAERMIATIQF